jgi:hypothetical protein
MDLRAAFWTSASGSGASRSIRRIAGAGGDGMSGERAYCSRIFCRLAAARVAAGPIERDRIEVIDGDAASAQEIAVLRGHDGVSSAFSPDGLRIVTAARNEAIG